MSTPSKNPKSSAGNQSRERKLADHQSREWKLKIKRSTVRNPDPSGRPDRFLPIADCRLPIRVGGHQGTKAQWHEVCLRLLFLFFFGFLLPGCGGTKVDAKFRLGPGPIMVFVDDPHERIDYPPMRRYVWEDLSQELVRTQSTQRIIPLETEDILRRTMPDFAKRGCREIGELAGAEQVIWIEVRDYMAQELIVDSSNAAFLSVTIKALNVQEKDRRRVRAWPVSPEGESLTVSMTGASTARAKSKDGIAKELSAKLAVQVARLFHDHELLDFEHSP